MRRTFTVVAAAAVMIGLAAPAFADHYVTATDNGCYAGAIASLTGRNLSTDRVRITTDASGATTWVCTFRDVGPSSAEENGYVDYVVPARATRTVSRDACWELDEDGFPVRVADADVLFLPSGIVRISCTLPAAP